MFCFNLLFLRIFKLWYNSWNSNHCYKCYPHCYFYSSSHGEFFSPSTMASYHHQHCWLLFVVVFIWFLFASECDHLLRSLITPEEISWAIILSLYIIMSYFQRNDAVSPSPWFILVFCHFYLFPPRGWVQPLFGITDSIGSNFMSDNFITIYHYFIQHPYRIYFAVSQSLEI